ncbi:GntR family transcriptional regulator [Streptococcus pasteurianus]|uniref:GntR family transcriptional regulator n=1 Tax=Streptococcus pasteurianus TaxID=197614 RepID=UPI0030136344
MAAKYQILADDLLEKILKGEYSIGSMIPPESKLQEIYQVSRHTVRQALSLLIQQGYLKAEKGSGTFVLNYKESHKSKSQSTKTIGVITTYLSDYIFPTIIEGIEEVLREHGYSLMLNATNNDPVQEEECLQSMIAQGVDGFLVEPTSSNEYNPNIAYYSQLREEGTPVYFLNAYYEMLDVPYASLDDEKAGYEATKYLVNKGHKKVGLITKMDDMQGKLRMKGFVKMHEEAALPFQSRYIATFTTKNQSEVISQYVKTILSSDDHPTALVCYNDQVASQLIQAMREAGLTVPEALSLVSHDNSYLAQAQQITSVKHPKKQLGREAAKQLLDAIEKKDEMSSILYDPEIIERDSVKEF